MSEELNIQAEKLQRFIDGEISLDELSIEKDVLEGLFVIRPELSPKPKILIDKVWMEYQRKIEIKQCDENDSMLILESPLPLPKVKIEDIISSIESGPLLKKADELEPFILDGKKPKQSETRMFVLNQNNLDSNLIEFPDANKKAEQIQNNRWQRWSVILLAAGVLCILLPYNILNSNEASIQSPIFSSNSKRTELDKEGEGYQQKYDIPEYSFKRYPVQNMKTSQQSTPMLEHSLKTKKAKIRKKNAIPTISSETSESRSSKEVFSEENQKGAEIEMPLGSTNRSRKDIQSELKITKEVESKSTTGSFDDAFSDNNDVDIGDLYEERSAQVAAVDENIEDVVVIQKRRPNKRSRDELVSKRRSKNSAIPSTNTLASSMVAEKNLIQKKPEQIAEKEELLEKQLEDRDITSNILIKIQIHDAAGNLDMNHTDISFQYGTQNVIPYKSAEGFWVFSLPVKTVGKLVVNNIQSEAFLARDQHICRMVDQKIICE